MKSVIQLAIFFCVVKLYAQDTIILRNCDTVHANIMEVNAAHIDYKEDTAKAEHQYIPVSEIAEIHCSDHSVMLFNDSNWRMSAELTANGLDTICPEYLYKLGVYDADHHYDSYHDAATLTFFTTALLGALPGCVPGTLCSRIPRKKNLDYPSEALINNSSYYNGYLGEATHIKRNKILGNYLWGDFFAIVFTVILVSAK